MCFPDSMHVELCFSFVKNVKSYSKMKPPGPQLLWAPPWAAVSLGSPEAFPLAMRTQSPLTPKHTGREHLPGGLTEGCRSLGQFSSYLQGIHLGLDAGFCVKYKSMQSVHETTPRQRRIFQALLDLQGVKNGKSFFLKWHRLGFFLGKWN